VLKTIFPLLIAALPWVSAGGQTPPAKVDVRLSPGDVLRIDVLRNKELSCECIIAADGTLTHPLYRELNVVGIPMNAVEERIRTFLTRYEANPAFVETPLLRIIVSGQVRQPTIYTVPPGTTVAQAIALAGGVTERGRLDRVVLRRESGNQIVDITKPYDSVSRVEIRSGDEIVIPRSRNVLQDVVAPSASVIAALAALTSIVIQVTRHN